ncbi:MAG: hypothetical protein ACPGVO_02880 [Spirulinaceae cyanobacterium]
MGKRQSRKLKIPQDKIQQEGRKVDLSPQEQNIFTLVNTEADAQQKYSEDYAYIVLKYFQGDWQCFSDWEKQELRQLTRFVRKISQQTWIQVYSSKGFKYTQYELSDVRNNGAKSCFESVLSQITGDVKFFELRVDGEMRVHGFRCRSAFFLVLLDRNHEVFPDGGKQKK